MRSVSESLAGRVDVLELEALTLAEVRSAYPEMSVEEVIIRGGYPELYEKPHLDADAWYRSYVATYLERDVRQLHAVGSLRDFERFLRACALRSFGVNPDSRRVACAAGPSPASVACDDRTGAVRPVIRRTPLRIPRQTGRRSTPDSR